MTLLVSAIRMDVTPLGVTIRIFGKPGELLKLKKETSVRLDSYMTPRRQRTKHTQLLGMRGAYLRNHRETISEQETCL